MIIWGGGPWRSSIFYYFSWENGVRSPFRWRLYNILQIHKVLISAFGWSWLSQVEKRRKQEWTLVGEGTGWWARLQQLLLLWVHERKFALVKKPCWRTRDFNAFWSAKRAKKKDFNATLKYKAKKEINWGMGEEHWLRKSFVSVTW